MRLVYFSPVSWDSYEQRPHYFARSFLDAGGHAVVWVNPYPSRLPGWRDLARADLRDAPLVLPRPAGVTVVNAGGLPIDPLPGGARLNARLYWKATLEELGRAADARDTVIGIARPTELALAALGSLAARWSFYDAMDDFPAFYRGRSRAATARVEQDIVQRVDRVLASSTRLCDKFSASGKPVTLLRNAFDMSLLPPFDPDRLRAAHFGFVGCMGGWFDWPTVLRLAAAVSPAPVTLIGPVAARTPRSMPANIQLHPACTQAEGSAWLKTFSAGLIPFVQNTLTAGVDPIKYYQYRGAGLPVLSTRFGDMAVRGAADATFHLDDATGILPAVSAATAYRSSPAEVARFRADNTWAERFRAAGVWDFR